MNTSKCYNKYRKEIAILSFLILQVIFGFCQLSYNGSFEFINGQNLPRIWHIQPKKDYTISIDSTIFFRGKKSILIQPTTYFNEFSEVMFWQELNLSGFRSFKTLKVVEYIEADNFDSVNLKIGFNKICSDGLKQDTGVKTIEPVFKNAILWHKITYKSTIDSNCRRTNIWNVIYNTSRPVHIDGIEIFIDDKKIDDVPLEKGYYPDKKTIAWMDGNAKNIMTNGVSYNVNFFPNEVGKSEIVALGESTHGTKEFTTLRLGLIRKLVKENNFSVLVFENQLESSLCINNALLTKTTTKVIVDSLFDAAHRTKETCEILDWVRKYNKTSSRKISIAGVDMQSYWAVMAFLKIQMMDKKMRDRLNAIDTLQLKAKTYQDFEKLQQLAVNFQENYYYLFKTSKERKLVPIKELLLEKTLEQLINAYKKKLLSFKSMSLRSPAEEDNNFRDSIMASNAIWLCNKYFKGRKLILLAHNEHISKAKNILNADPGYKNINPMGKYLYSAYREKYLTYALLTGNGTVTGFNNSGLPSIFPLQSPDIDSYEYYFDKCVFSNFYSRLSQKALSDESGKLFKNLQWRSLGFDGGKNGFQFKFYNLAENFDGLFFLKNSSSSVSTITIN